MGNYHYKHRPTGYVQTTFANPNMLWLSTQWFKMLIDVGLTLPWCLTFFRLPLVIRILECKMKQMVNSARKRDWFKKWLFIVRCKLKLLKKVFPAGSEGNGAQYKCFLISTRDCLKILLYMKVNLLKQTIYITIAIWKHYILYNFGLSWKV